MTDDDELVIWCAGYWPILSAEQMADLKAAADQRKWDALPESEKAKSLALARSFRMVAG